MGNGIVKYFLERKVILSKNEIFSKDRKLSYNILYKETIFKKGWKKIYKKTE